MCFKLMGNFVLSPSGESTHLASRSAYFALFELTEEAEDFGLGFRLVTLFVTKREPTSLNYSSAEFVLPLL